MLHHSAWCIELAIGNSGWFPFLQVRLHYRSHRGRSVDVGPVNRESLGAFGLALVGGRSTPSGDPDPMRGPASPHPVGLGSNIQAPPPKQYTLVACITIASHTDNDPPPSSPGSATPQQSRKINRLLNIQVQQSNSVLHFA